LPKNGLDKRWIFLSIGLTVLLFLKIPLNLSYNPEHSTVSFYEAVENLPPGSVIYLSVDYGPSSQAELLPMHEAMVYHLFKKDIKIISASVVETGPPVTDKVFKKITEKLKEESIQKEYGRDYVNLGYKAGQDIAMAKIGTSIPETYPTDYRGKKTEDLPLMKGIINFKQVEFLCSISSGNPGVRQWLQQVQARYRVRMLAGVTAVMAPDLYSFYHSKQIEGFLGGLAGAADYEYMLKRPGLAMMGMNVQSLVHFLILAFIAAGNFIYFRDKIREKREVAKNNTMEETISGGREIK
jgi:hypothetical protein